MKVVKISLLSEEKKKKMRIRDKIKRKRDYSKYIDGFILFMIVFTSFAVVTDVVYVVVPISLIAVFVLLQIKKLVSKKVEIKK